MKVKLEEEYKSRYTLEDLAIAKQLIKDLKEDEETAAGWAEYAITEALKGTGDYLRKVYEASARTARNGRIWNAYGDYSQRFDVWIEASARTADGFIEVGAYLTDIYGSGAVDYKEHMYIQYFTK